jgi:hypothetical protein
VGSEEGAKCGAVSERKGVIGAAAACVGGGGGGARSGFRRKKTTGPADRAAGLEGGRERGGPRQG